MPTPARIVFVLKSFRFGGAERQALLVAKHLATTGQAQVHVLGYSAPEGRVRVLCDEANIPSDVFPARLHNKMHKLAPMLVQLAFRLRRLRPDVLVPFLNIPNITCGALWQLAGAKASIWCQRNEGLELNGRRLERFAVQNTPYFVANSRSSAEAALRAGADPERLRVIPNAVSLRLPRESPEAWRRRLGVAPDQRVAAMVAHFREPKDHETLLKAWSATVRRMRGQGQPVLLALAGRAGPTYDACREQIRRLNIEDHVRLLGNVNDVSGMLGVIDVGVHSSLSEGSPNAVQEFMMAGLPVAGTDLGSIRDLLGNRDHLAPRHDSETLADHLVRLLGDVELSRGVGRTNRARADERFRPNRVLAQWEQLFQECLESCLPSGGPS